MLLLLACASPAAPTSLAAVVDEPAVAVTPGDRAVAEALAWLGTPYRWEGRGTTKLPGMDCLGLLFRAWGKVNGTSWTAYAVNPSELVASGRLGDPVPGLAAVLREDVDARLLEPGDVLYFLIAEREIPDEPLWVHEGRRYWPWHTGLYSGGGRVIQAEPGGVVNEGSLERVPYDALYVTRMPPQQG